MIETSSKEEFRDNQRSCSGFRYLTSKYAMESVHLKKFNKLPSSAYDLDRCFVKRFVESESEQDSGGSSEETDSPRSVCKSRSKHRNFAVVHHQVLKIREEDLHLGEDIGEAKEKIDFHHLRAQIDAFILSRPILPASPLSGKTAIRSFN